MKVLRIQAILLPILTLVLALPAMGQKKAPVKKTVKVPEVDTNEIIHDIYSGILPSAKGDSVETLLALHHKRNHAEGTFDLDETYIKQGARGFSLKTMGNWQERKDYPDDIDATMVELSNADRIEFFLRREDGDLQHLSPIMKEIEPAGNYILALRHSGPTQKTKDVPTQYETEMRKLTGTYSGKLPCPHCNSISSTLVLRFGKGHATAGDYILTDKYIGGSKGDVTDVKKGRWHYESKRIEADHKSTIIVLDYDKKGRETYYFVKKNGIIQLDRSLQPIPSATDQTLKKY